MLAGTLRVPAAPLRVSPFLSHVNIAHLVCLVTPPRCTDRLLFLDDRTGDAFGFKPDRNVWMPRFNVGMARSDKAPVLTTYKPKVIE